MTHALFKPNSQPYGLLVTILWKNKGFWSNVKSSHALWRMRKTKYRQPVNRINSFFWGFSWSQILETDNSVHPILLLHGRLSEKGAELVMKKTKLKIAWSINFSCGYLLHLGEPELKSHIINSLFKWYFYYPLNIT